MRRGQGGPAALRVAGGLLRTRRVGETIYIGNDITVTVLGINGSQVQIGTDAPDEVAVHREEIYARVWRIEIQTATGS